jgi:chromosome partitioning protein
MIRILVSNSKGGCGKTTIATNLAGMFARAGLPTALADSDRQRSALAWLARRDAAAPPIVGLDWRKNPGEVPPGIARLVIDAPAALRGKEVEALLLEADLVVVPILPSLFDEVSSARFLARLDELKPVRRGKKPVLVVANRLRARSRARQRLETFLAELGHPPVARLAERALYGELALEGLSVFDAPRGEAAAALAEWRPLLRAIEEAG